MNKALPIDALLIFLWLCQQELDMRCEELIQRQFDQSCNFDVDDAVHKLEKLGIVVQVRSYRARENFYSCCLISSYSFSNLEKNKHRVRMGHISV